VAESRFYPEIFLEVPWNTPKDIRRAAVPVENRIRNLANVCPERYHYTKLQGLLLMTMEERRHLENLTTPCLRRFSCSSLDIWLEERQAI